MTREFLRQVCLGRHHTPHALQCLAGVGQRVLGMQQAECDLTSPQEMLIGAGLFV